MTSEADYMYTSQMSELGAEEDQPEPEYEVIMGKKQRRVFAGSRAACWDFRRVRGGFVREYTGSDNCDEYQ